MFPRSLRIAVLPLNGLFEVDTQTDGEMVITGGLEEEYLKVLSKSLNFKMKILAPADGEWGRETENGSWTGLVGMVLRNESDIGIGGLAVTEKRHKVIDYSAPYRYTYLTFATNLSPKLPKFTAFLYPFTLELWIALAMLLIAMPFVFKLLLSKKVSLGENLFYILKPLLSESLLIRHNGTTRDYFLLGGSLAGSMFLTCCYSANLLSFLTIPLNERGIQNIKQLSEEVAHGGFIAGAFKGTNVLNILRASQHPSIAAMADHIEKNKYHIEGSIDAVEEFYRSKRSALIAPAVYFQMNFPNVLQISPEPIKCTDISMAVSKSFCCKRRLDSHIRRMFDSGVSQQILKRILAHIEIKSSVRKTYGDQDITLNLEDLMGAFIFFIMGNILSVITLSIEMIISKLQRIELKVATN